MLLKYIIQKVEVSLYAWSLSYVLISVWCLSVVAGNVPFAAAGWEFRERKLGKSTKDN